jgi:hypothetical protein
MIPLITNNSYFLLLPIINFNNVIPHSKVKFVSLYSNYDKDSDNRFNKRVYIVTYLLDKTKVQALESNSNYLKTLYIDNEEELIMFSFKIPSEFLLDIQLISIGDYTKTSDLYKKKVYEYHKDKPITTEKLRLMFNPTKQDFDFMSEKYLMDGSFDKYTTELGRMFNNIEETFSLSSLMK